MRWTDVVLVVSVLSQSSCGGARVATAAVPSAEEASEQTCSSASDPLNPFVVEWPGTSRVALAAASQHGIVFVSYVGCKLEVLSACQAGGNYDLTSVTPARDRVAIHDQSDLRARLPFAVASLEADLRAAGRLDFEYVAVGQRVARQPPAAPAGDCQGATHYVESITVGAYTVDAAGEASTSAGAAIGDVGVGASHREGVRRLRGSGSIAACQQPGATGCDAILKIGLAALPRTPARRGSTQPPAAPIEVSMTYSSGKRAWIEEAAGSFRLAHPEIKLTLAAAGSFEASQAILEERDKPLVFSPADSLELTLFDAAYRAKFHAAPFGTSGEDAPQSLLATPLVFVLWEDRATALLSNGAKSIDWKMLRKAIASKSWSDIGGKAEWGRVKLGHTDPTKSNSGAQALVLMSYEYLGKTSGLDSSDILRPGLAQFLAGIESGVAKFENTTGNFMTDMIRFGPSTYDAAVVYENLAIEQLADAPERWGALHVYYPPITVWSDHPVVLLPRSGASERQRSAARLWIAFLRSRPLQERALAFGFRPGDPAVAVKTVDTENPFTRFAKYGVKIDIPLAAPMPDEPVMRGLLEVWARSAHRPARGATTPLQ